MAISDQEKTAVVDWLTGKLKKGSQPERQAQRAMARIYREERLPISLLYLLADSIDPDHKRKRGNPKKNHRQIAALVWHRIKADDKMEAALQHAVDELGVSRTTAKNAFRDWEP